MASALHTLLVSQIESELVLGVGAPTLIVSSKRYLRRLIGIGIWRRFDGR